jgi:Caspase domain
LAQMDNAGNRMNIVILDACRNNPFTRSFRSSSRGLAPIDAPSGTLIAYATAPGSVASDGDARNGLYTQELLKNIRTPGLGIEEVFKQVRVSVRNLTQGQQTPWESSSLTGDFYISGIKPAGNISITKLEGTKWKGGGRRYTFLNGGKFVWRDDYKRSGEGTWQQSGEDITMNIPNRYIDEDGKIGSFVGNDWTFRGAITAKRIIGVLAEPRWSYGAVSGGGDSPFELVRIN